MTLLPETSTILIIDDVPENMRILGSVLERAGYQTLFATSEAEAVALLARETPDLLLLDVTLAGMDGYAVCRRLKERPVTRNLPVIFITARTAAEDIVAGFDAGGVDYIAKPFHDRELLARVRVHLGLHRAQQVLAAANATKDRFMTIVAHDLRGPMGTLAMGLELLQQAGQSEAQRREYAGKMHASALRLIRLMEDLLDWSRLQREQMTVTPVCLDLTTAARQQTELLTGSAGVKQIGVTVNEAAVAVMADAAMTATIIRNLLGNAIKYARPGGHVVITASVAGSMAELSVTDDGVGMSPSRCARLFELAEFSSRAGTSGERGTGLGLIMCRDFARRNGGDLTITSAEGEGTTATLTLPAVPVPAVC